MIGENAVCNCGKAHVRTCPLNPRNFGKVQEHEMHILPLQKGANVGNVQSIQKEDGNAPSNACFRGISPPHSPLEPTHPVACGQTPRRKRSLAFKQASPLTPSPKRRAVSRRRLHVVDSPNNKSPVNAKSPDLIVTAFQAGPKDIPVNPPSREWMAAAVDYIHFWSKSRIVKHHETDAILDDSSVFPHKIDWIDGDGHCLFRAISKSITGTQKNHQAVRKAVVNWMLCADHPPAVAKYVVSYEWQAEIERDNSICPQAMQEYIDTSGMSHCAWGSDKELVAFATMLQTTIFVSNKTPGGLVWNSFCPLFWNQKNCMAKKQLRSIFTPF